MHTVWVRLNAVVFFGLTVLLGLSCLAGFSKIMHSQMHQPSKLYQSYVNVIMLQVKVSFFRETEPERNELNRFESIG